MTIDFYYIAHSAPCRTVLLAAKAIGLDLNLKLIDLTKGDNLTPEYLKLNPQHTVPTIDDNGFSLWESRVIITYFQDQYGKNDSLYPRDPKKRALVDQRLYFDLGTLYESVYLCYFKAAFGGTELDPAKREDVDKALKFFDTFLENSIYAASDTLSLADFSLLSTVSTIDAFGHDLSPYTNVNRWYAKLKELPYYEEANGQYLHYYDKFTAKWTKK